jgi:rubrerythrin
MARPRIYATREEYLAAHRDTTIAWRDIRRLRGQCPQCGRPWEGPQWNCPRCRERNAVASRAKRARHRVDREEMSACDG